MKEGVQRQSEALLHLGDQVTWETPFEDGGEENS